MLFFIEQNTIGVKEMTDLLENAVEKVKQLSAEKQDAIAALILDEIGDDALWDKKFSSSLDLLEQLATEAEEEDRKGLTKILDPDAM